MAREPVRYSEGVADAICLRLCNGETLRAICKLEGMPDFATVWRWEKDREDFRNLSARAREIGTHHLADECIAIADTPVMGIVEKFERVEIADPDDPDAPPTTELQLTERRQEDMLAHRRLQIDTRMRLIGKWNAKYADKTVHSNDPENPLIGMSDGQLDAAIDQKLAKLQLGGG